MEEQNAEESENFWPVFSCLDAYLISSPFKFPSCTNEAWKIAFHSLLLDSR